MNILWYREYTVPPDDFGLSGRNPNCASSFPNTEENQILLTS